MQSEHAKNVFGYFSVGLLAIWYLMMYYNHDVFPVNSYKYPPRSYYIIYGALWSLALYGFNWVDSFPIHLKKWVSYISEHSLWIYLWHIVPVVIANSVDTLQPLWLIKWLSCYAIAILIAWIQVSTISWIQRKYAPNAKWLNYLKA